MATNDEAGTARRACRDGAEPLHASTSGAAAATTSSTPSTAVSQEAGRNWTDRGGPGPGSPGSSVPSPSKRRVRSRCRKIRHAKTAHHARPIHWLVLFLSCMLLFGNYYCYDIPAALNVQLQHWIGSDYSYYQWQLNLLYSVYSAPNVVLPVIGGLLVDRLGPARMLVGFTLCVIIGQSMFAWGVSTRAFGLMVLGRLVFGLGGESLEVAQARITTDWFRGRGLGFALSLNLASARLATAVNDNVSPLIQELTNTAYASWFGAIVCVLSAVAGSWMLVLDRPDIRRRAGVGITCADIMEHGTGGGEEGEPLLSREEEAQVPSPGKCDAPVSAKDAGPPSVMFVDETGVNAPVADGALSVGHHHRHRSDTEGEMSLEAEIVEDEKMRIADIIQLQPSFWVLCLICILLYGSVVPFIHISSDFLQTKWYPGNPRKAGSVMSIPDIVSAIGSPLCGFVIDRLGHRALYLPAAGLILMTVHLLLGWTTLDPVMGLILLGVAYSMFASSIWPCIPYLVGSHQLGTAYGLMTVALNISLTLLPLVVANIRGSTETEGFTGVETFFVCLSLGGVLLGIVLNVLDARNGSPLQRSAFRRPQSAGGYSQLSAEEDFPWSPGSQDSAATTATAAEADLEGEEDGGLSDEEQEQEDMERDDANITTRVVAEGVVAMIRHYPRRHQRTRSVGDDDYDGGRAGGFRRPKSARQLRHPHPRGDASTRTGRRRSCSHPPRFRVQPPDVGGPAGAAAAPPTPATASAAVPEPAPVPGFLAAAVSAPPAVDGGGPSDSELLFAPAAGDEGGAA